MMCATPAIALVFMCSKSIAHSLKVLMSGSRNPPGPSGSGGVVASVIGGKRPPSPTLAISSAIARDLITGSSEYLSPRVASSNALILLSERPTSPTANLASSAAVLNEASLASWNASRPRRRQSPESYRSCAVRPVLPISSSTSRRSERPASSAGVLASNCRKTRFTLAGVTPASLPGTTPAIGDGPTVMARWRAASATPRGRSALVSSRLNSARSSRGAAVALARRVSSSSSRASATSVRVKPRPRVSLISAILASTPASAVLTAPLLARLTASSKPTVS